jgi:hypothetical protein
MQTTYDPDLLRQARVAVLAANPQGRWATALDKAMIILTEWPLVTPHQDADGHDGLLMRSEDSSELYFANGECAQLLANDHIAPCPAYSFDQPCKHRAAVLLHNAYFALVEAKKARLIHLARESARAERSAQEKKAAYDKALREINELIN